MMDISLKKTYFKDPAKLLWETKPGNVEKLEILVVAASRDSEHCWSELGAQSEPIMVKLLANYIEYMNSTQK